jgi:hypothetical protein
MSKFSPMLHEEVIACLRTLDDDTLSSIMRMIFDWNDGIEVKPKTQLEKFAWALVLPKLEQNRENYNAKVKQTTEAANKRWNKNTDTNASERMREKPNYNYNYNSSNNSSKEELLNNKQPPSSVDESVVSKGLESLENIFPQGRNYVGIDEVNLWNSLTQEQKKVMIKRASMYIRNEKKKDEGKYIKGMGKWMREQCEKGLEEKQPSMKNSTKADDPRLLKMTDGSIYSILLEKVSGQTKQADKLYYLLNKKEMFTSKGELLSFVTSLNQREINDLIN